MTNPGESPMEQGTTAVPNAERPSQIRPHHLAKLAVSYVRQSSPAQVRENTGSTASQLALADRARRYGWPDSRIRSITDDLGLSGTSSQNRTGFQQLLDLIERDQVGIVFYREESRVSRNPLDAERFLSVAIQAGILIEVQGHVLDTGDASLPDLFATRIKFLLAWWENAARTQMFRAAKEAKVRGRCAVSRPPIGYVVSVLGQWIKDPDPAVQAAVQRLFDLYPRLGSIRKVVLYHRDHNLLFPLRRGLTVMWRILTSFEVQRILRCPQYYGDYIFEVLSRGV